MHIRHANHRDAAQLLALRNHYIANSLAVFDEKPMSQDMLTTWMASFESTSPYHLIVAVEDDLVLGYASSQRYRDHPAFLKTVETSIYIAPGRAKAGVGSSLYKELFAVLEQFSLHRAVVGIALPNDGSIRLHSKFGFSKVGVFDEYACKNGTFVSSVWMQKSLSPASLKP